MATNIERLRRRSQERGFTLMELLLVIAIISLLIALLLPAIQSSRELARKLQCTKNLMQIGLALGNYASSNKVFPPGVVNQKGPISSVPDGYHWGWGARILPFLERTPIYHHLNFQQSVYDDSNDTSRGHRIDIYLCPSDGVPGLNNYAACHHDLEAPIAADNHGVFYLNSRVSYDDIKDGPSCTILAGEFLHKTQSLGWAFGTRSSLRNTGSPINAIIPFKIETPSFNNPPGQSSELDELANKIEGGDLDPFFVGGFSSSHPGGANFLLGDGSVRFLTERIRPSVYQSLGHRSDGNLISADEF
jgi:prepilin-type N-terminal cleavage/methylation domain-containing protein/prepilin-type processing-associated H-X9-DG protein